MGQFHDFLVQNTPPVNPLIMNGVGQAVMQRPEDYLHKVFMNLKGYPPGLRYLGCKRCTPLEEYTEYTRVKNNKRTADISQSDLYLVKFMFEFEGERLPDRYLSLPIIGEAGTFHLSGTMYHVTPVISDKVISPGQSSVFVRVLRDRNSFYRCYHSITVDSVRITTHVIWASLYRRNSNTKKLPPTTKANTCNIHYLLAKYGFSETFRKYTGCIPKTGGSEINSETFPESDWVIVESTKIQPKTSKDKFYKPTEIRLAIPRHIWNDNIREFCAGFFYVVDHFPLQMTLPFLETKEQWMMTLGSIIFSGNHSHSKLIMDIKDHLISLDDCMDSIAIEKLADRDICVDTYYDLLAVIVKSFNQMVLEDTNSNLNMWLKNLDVMYYMLYDITSSMIKCMFEINKILQKRNRLLFQDVRTTMAKMINPGPIYKLASSRIVAEAVSYSGDHKYLKITSKAAMQEATGNGSRESKGRTVISEANHLDVSMISTGSILFLGKSNPSPTNRLNPYAKIDINTGNFIQNPELEHILSETEKALKTFYLPNRVVEK
jgi:hypothetical protein